MVTTFCTVCFLGDLILDDIALDDIFQNTVDTSWYSWRRMFGKVVFSVYPADTRRIPLDH